MIFSSSITTADESTPSGDAPSDRQHLDAFIHNKDQAAFEALVRRHGPMVFGVCRRLLGNEHDAADAFQAVFIVLARKAAAIRTPEVLGAWLYNVAYRTSVKARAAGHKRQARERQVSVMPQPAVEDDAAADEVLAVLDDELRALPAKYQAPVVLCELQGQSRREAAEQLKVPQGTLSSRLATARRKLAQRLKRRGVVISAPALCAILAENALASVPTTLVASTVAAAAPLVAGQVAAGTVSANALALSDGVVKAMLLAKLKLIVLSIVVPCLLSGAGLLGLTFVAAQPDEEAAALATLQQLGAKLRWQLMPTGKQLVAVDLKRSGVQDEHVRLLPVFKELREVILTETGVTDASCAALGSMPKLQTLRLQNTGVSNSGLKPLAALQELRILTLGWTKVDGDGLQELAPLVELHELDLRKTGVADAHVKDLAPLKKLQTLDLGETRVTNAGLNHLAPLAQLRVLRLDRTAVTDAGMRELAPLIALSSLSVESNPGITDAGVKDLPMFQQLTALNLSGTRVTDAMVRDLARFKNLRWLSLDGTALTGTGFDDPKAFALNSLHLSGTKVADTGAKHIAKLSTLKTLHLDNTAVTDAGIKEFAALTQLESLALENSQATDANMRELAGLKGLWLLNISGTKITDAGLKELKAFPALRWLAIHKTVVGDMGAKELAALQGLDTLWASWTQITETGLKGIAQLKNLRTLRLGGLPVTDAGLKDIANLKNLITLWLDWTKVTDVGLKELLALERLEELRLDGTDVSGVGVKELAGLKRLKHVELPKTQVTAAGAKALKSALPNVTINTKDAGQGAAEPSESARAFWWLLALAGVVTGGGVFAWLWVRRKNILAPALVCSGIGVLVVVGYHVLPILLAQPAPAVREGGPKELWLRGHTGPVQGLRFTPDGRRLVSGSGWPGNDTTVRIWDVATGQELFRIKAPGQVGGLALSADGKLALAGTHAAILLVEVETGQVVNSFRGHRNAVGTVSFAADGRHAYSSSLDGTARRWDLQTGKEVGQVRVAGKWARCAIELSDGKLVTGTNNGILQIWDKTMTQEVKRIETGIAWLASATLAPGGRHVVACNWDAAVWDLESGRKVRTFTGHQGEIPKVAFSPDGMKMLTVSYDGAARIWDFAGGEQLQELVVHDEFLSAAAWSHDGKQIAVGGGGRKLGDQFKGGESHDIRVGDAPTAPEAAEIAADGMQTWWWVAGGVGLAAALAAFLVYRRYRSAVPKRTAANGNATAESASSSLTFACGHCKKTLKIKAHLAGRKVKCPGCGAPTQAPAGVG